MCERVGVCYCSVVCCINHCIHCFFVNCFALFEKSKETMMLLQIILFLIIHCFYLLFSKVGKTSVKIAMTAWQLNVLWKTTPLMIMWWSRGSFTENTRAFIVIHPSIFYAYLFLHCEQWPQNKTYEFDFKASVTVSSLVNSKVIFVSWTKIMSWFNVGVWKTFASHNPTCF